MSVRILFVLAVTLWTANCAVFLPGSARAQDADSIDDIDLLALELIPGDSNAAARLVNRLDKDGDGKLNAEEMRKLDWAIAPAKFDVNKNGVLTKLEVALQFAYNRTSRGVLKVDNSAAFRYLTRYDRNEDRRLDADEIRAGGWPEDPESFDENKDGSLTLDEIAHRFSLNRRDREERGVTGMDQRQAILFRQSFDENGDRRLSYDEFRHAGLSLDPKKFDGNDDGALTIIELANGFADRRKELGVNGEDQKNAQGHIARYDRNGDGELDQEEIIMAKWPEKPSRFDLDNNKRLTRLEIAAGFAKQRRERGVTEEHQAAAARLIGRFDRNANGQIDLFEISAPGAPDDEDKLTVAVFVEHDENFDERLTRPEVAAYLASREKKEGKD